VRRAIVGAALAVLFSCASPQVAAAQAVNCSGLGDRATVVERTICGSPDLIRTDSEIVALTAELEATLRGAFRDALVETKAPFLRKRNACANPVGAPSSSPDTASLSSCVAAALAERRNALITAKESPASMQWAVFQYDLLDVSFFRRFGELIVDRDVQLFGCLNLLPGSSAAARVRGALHAACEDDGPFVPVVFKSMTAQNAQFVDEKRPVTFWKGRVERRDGELTIYADTFLGAPLP